MKFHNIFFFLQETSLLKAIMVKVKSNNFEYNRERKKQEKQLINSLNIQRFTNNNNNKYGNNLLL
jgi:hypothetical protein